MLTNEALTTDRLAFKHDTLARVDVAAKANAKLINTEARQILHICVELNSTSSSNMARDTPTSA